MGYTIRHCDVTLSEKAQKQLRKVPGHVVAKLLAWVDLVETDGLMAAQNIPGFRDHALHGRLHGLRAIRLSKQWRAVYVIHSANKTAKQIVTLEVLEVHPHDY